MRPSPTWGGTKGLRGAPWDYTWRSWRRLGPCVGPAVHPLVSPAVPCGVPVGCSGAGTSLLHPRRVPIPTAPTGETGLISGCTPRCHHGDPPSGPFQGPHHRDRDGQGVGTARPIPPLPLAPLGECFQPLSLSPCLFFMAFLGAVPSCGSGAAHSEPCCLACLGFPPGHAPAPAAPRGLARTCRAGREARPHRAGEQQKL